MGNEGTPARGLSDAVKVALIGASATILVAIISGLFALARRDAPAPAPTTMATVGVTVAPTSVAVAAHTPIGLAPTATPTEPAATATVAASQAVTGTGFAFASKISPDGVALDPGMAFPAAVKEIYAVFQPGRTPPGLEISHPDPAASAYYAYLEPAGPAQPVTVGWQWFLNGELVRDYETTTDVGYLWLSVYAQGAEGLFEGALGPPGIYDVYITIAGNPALRTQLVVQP